MLIPELQNLLLNLFSHHTAHLFFPETELDFAYLLFINKCPPVSSANVIASPGSLLSHSLPTPSLLKPLRALSRIHLNSKSTVHHLG